MLCKRISFNLTYFLLSNLENRDSLKSFRNVDCVLANHKKSLGHASKAQNHKLITVALCGFVISRLIGLFLETQ